MNTIKTGALFAALLVLPLAVGAGCSSPPPPPPTCGPDELLVEGVCLIADANCTPDVPGSLVARCAAEHRQCFADTLGAMCGLCEEGFRDEAGLCRPVATCDQLDCAARLRGCTPPGKHTDAVCGGCVEGAQLTAAGVCESPSCDPSLKGSVASGCETQRRSCELVAGSPRCGSCWNGYVDDLGACRAVKTCESLGCAAANRTCDPEGAHQDARCGGCKGGYSDAGGSCVVLSNATCDPAPAQNSIADACNAEHRECTPGAPARCGGCQTTFVEDTSSGACVPQQGCSQLDCAARFRECTETPYGRCTDCVAGYVQDAQTGGCRPARACSDLNCPSGSECIAGTSSTDAVCRTTCDEGRVWNGTSCQTCPSCNREGEDGVWPSTTVDGYCVCKTAPGYFYSVGADVGTFPCDSDDDGWVRESARAALNSNDPVIRDNARCSLRSIDRFELVNEGAQSRVITLTTALALYETDRNDDDSILGAVLRQRGVPAYGPTRDVTAAELNRLTKLCYFSGADYNDNGVADTDEYANGPLPPSYRPDQADFIRFSYFAELDFGTYVPSAGNALLGRYVIREKSRLATGRPAAERVPLAYPSGDGDYWRECRVKTDSEAATLNPPIGMDFAEHTTIAGGFDGMNHHSQFKCVVIENEPNPAIPSQLTAAQAGQRRLRLNACRAASTSTPVSGNTTQLEASCALANTTSAQPGEVYWAAQPYEDYDLHDKWEEVPNRPYVRGCVNECSERMESCPHWNVNPDGVSCEYAANDFGKFGQCISFEVCDGKDNNGNGSIDEGDPGGGFTCANDGTSYPKGYPTSCSADSACAPTQGIYCISGKCQMTGVCVNGVTHCLSGEVKCVPNVAPGSRTETCNNLDDDCDKLIDEGNPGGGVQNCNTGNLGVCAAGKLSCQNGTLSLCVQQTQPSNELCDGLDNDCDGAADEPPDDGTCASPWARYYYDGDDDTYGNKNDAIGACTCDVGSSVKIDGGSYVKNKTDCCDTDFSSKPGATTPRTATNACGSWDWNCDGSVTQTSSTSVTAGCGYRAFSCGGASVGWADSVPACGASHTWYTSGCGDWAPCPQDREQRTQRCY